MKESCHSYERVMSQSHIWRRHFRFCPCLSRPSNAASYTQKTCCTYEGVVSQILRSHVTDMKETLQQLSISSIQCCIVYAGVMSHIWKRHFAHTWRSHVTDMKESCHSHTYEGDTFAFVGVNLVHPMLHHIWRSHVAHVKESYRTHEGAVSQIYRSHGAVTDIKETLLQLSVSISSIHDIYSIIYEGVISHKWRSHVAHMEESCHTYEGVGWHIWRRHSHFCLCLSVSISSIQCCIKYKGVMSHIWRSHVALMKESCHRYTEGTPAVVCVYPVHPLLHHIYMKESSHIYEGVMSQIEIRHSCSCPCLPHPSITASYIYEGVKSRRWRSHVTHMEQSCHTHTHARERRSVFSCNVWVWHDCFICVTWLLHLCKRKGVMERRSVQSCPAFVRVYLVDPVLCRIWGGYD